MFSKNSKYFLVPLGLLVLICVALSAMYLKFNNQKRVVSTMKNPLVETYRRQLAALEKNANANPKDYESNKKYVMAVYALNDNKKSQEALLNLISIQPNDPAAYNLLGNAYGTDGKQEEAIRAYEQSINLNPDQITAYINLANIYISSANNKDKGYQIFEELRQRNPQNTGILFMLAAIQERLGDKQEAQGTYKSILQIDPSNTVAKQSLETSE